MLPLCGPRKAKDSYLVFIDFAIRCLEMDKKVVKAFIHSRQRKQSSVFVFYFSFEGKHAVASCGRTGWVEVK